MEGMLCSGVDISHPLIQHNIFQNESELEKNRADDDQNGYIDDLCGWDFVHKDPTIFDGAEADRHGTAVAGLIVSMAPDVQILPLKFMEGTIGYTSDAIEAIAYAEQMGVKMSNCSWGSRVENIALQEAIANSEMLFICAGGNKQEGDVQNTVYR